MNQWDELAEWERALMLNQDAFDAMTKRLRREADLWSWRSSKAMLAELDQAAGLKLPVSPNPNPWALAG